MSSTISSEISRISGNVSDALDAIEAKGVTVPSGSNSDDLATLIAQISGGGTGAISIVDTADAAGGTVRTITALDISDTTAAAGDVASGKYFYTADGTKTAGTIATKTSSDLTASTLTVTAPAGYYASAASKTLTDANLVAANIKKDISIFGVTGTFAGGSGGLEYETGTYTPTSDIAKSTINFSKTHTDTPIFLMFVDTTGTSNTTTYSNYSMAYVDWWRMWGAGVPYSSSAYRYGIVQYLYRANSTSQISAATSQLQYTSDNTSTESASYPRFWVGTSSFYAYTNSTSRYWRSGRTYKWIAVWKPTT